MKNRLVNNQIKGSPPNHNPRPLTWFSLAALALAAFVVGCSGPRPTTSPTPTAVVVAPATIAPAQPTAAPAIPTLAPTAVLPSPTAVVVPTEQPTVAVTAAPLLPTRTAVPVVANTPVPTQSAPAATPTVVLGNSPLDGLYITNLRYDPTYPVNQEPVTWYGTILNRADKDQHYPLCVEIFRPDDKKSFGISNCTNITIPSGEHELNLGQWTGSGIKECIPLRARAVLSEEDEDNVRLVIPKTDGQELWVDFQICR